MAPVPAAKLLNSCALERGRLQIEIARIDITHKPCVVIPGMLTAIKDYRPTGGRGKPVVRREGRARFKREGIPKQR